MNRRNFLFGSGAMAAALGFPGSVRAAGAGDLKFVFVFAPGGWDPTRVLVDAFDNPNVAMEVDADRGVAGGISFVDHPARPSVRSFFDNHHARTLVLNGMLVRSVAHE